jgi:hypothetical protein
MEELKKFVFVENVYEGVGYVVFAHSVEEGLELIRAEDDPDISEERFDYINEEPIINKENAYKGFFWTENLMF